jgi:hypothetical protein
MRSGRLSASLLLAWAVTALAVAGCGGPSKVAITGKVTKNGQPLQVGEKTLVTVTFGPEDVKVGQTYPAKFNRQEGTYQVEIPPGKYTVNIVVAFPREPGRPPLSRPPEDAKTVYDLSEAKTLDIEIAKTK